MNWRASGPYVPRPGEDEPPGPAAAEPWPSTLYVPAARPADQELADRIEAALRTFPDFPSEGVLFRDVFPVFRDPRLFDDVLDRLAEAALEWEAGWVAAIESRGFLLGAPLAARLELPLAAIRKEGKLPGDTMTRSYDLEYGSAQVEIQTDGVPDGAEVFLVDDLLATGGTLRASAELLEDVGARVAGMGVLVELADLDGREMLKDYNFMSLLSL